MDLFALENDFFASVASVQESARAEIARIKSVQPEDCELRREALRGVKQAEAKRLLRVRKHYWAELEVFKNAHAKEWSRV